ncbi:MAG: MFS transporter [marine bacterium B5-7]|nr:MAG: MFS transporter [marine bacterium B5-7]
MSLWKNRQYTQFFIASGIGNLGDWFDIFALQIIFVHEFHATPMLMSMLLLMLFLPGMLLGAVAGSIVDRMSRRNVMFITDAASTALTLGLFYTQSMTVALILLFARSAFGVFNNPAQNAYTKQIVSPEHMLKASSYRSVVFQLCKVFGPILGASLLLIASARDCLMVNAISFSISALLIAFLPKDMVPERSTLHGKEKSSHWKQHFLEGITFTLRHRVLCPVIFVSVGWFFLFMMFNAQLAIYLKHLLPAHVNALGYYLGCDGVGAAIISILISRRVMIKHYAAYYAPGLLLQGIAMLGLVLFPLHGSLLWLYGTATMMGVGAGTSIVIFNYALKKECTDSHAGRVSGTFGMLQNAAMVTGTLISGYMAVHFGIHCVFMGMVVAYVALSLLALLWMKPSEIIG